MAPITRGVDALYVPPLRDSPVVMRPTPVDLDDTFVLVVSIGVVAGLTLFVLLQAVQALKEALRSREMQERLSTLPLYTKYGAFLLNPSADEMNGYTEEDLRRMNAGLTTGKGGPRLPPALPRRASRRRLLSPIPTTTNDSNTESSSGSSGADGEGVTEENARAKQARRPQGLESTVSFGQQSARSHWLGPHRCQFTLSPDEIVSSEEDSGDESDTSSTATFSHPFLPHHFPHQHHAGQHLPHHGDAKGAKERYPYAQGIVHFPKRRGSFSNGGRNQRRRPGVYLDLNSPNQRVHPIQHGEEEESESGLVSDATMVASAPSKSDKFPHSKNKNEDDYFSYVPKRSNPPPVPMQMTRICVVYDDTSSNDGTSSRDEGSRVGTDTNGKSRVAEERRRMALAAALDEANAMVAAWKEHEYTPRKHQRRTQPQTRPSTTSEQTAPRTVAV